MTMVQSIGSVAVWVPVGTGLAHTLATNTLLRRNFSCNRLLQGQYYSYLKDETAVRQWSGVCLTAWRMVCYPGTFDSCSATVARAGALMAVAAPLQQLRVRAEPPPQPVNAAFDWATFCQTSSDEVLNTSPPLPALLRAAVRSHYHRTCLCW